MDSATQLAIISMVLSVCTLIANVLMKVSRSKCCCMECQQGGGMEGLVETIVKENEKTEREIFQRLSKSSDSHSHTSSSSSCCS